MVIAMILNLMAIIGIFIFFIPGAYSMESDDLADYLNSRAQPLERSSDLDQIIYAASGGRLALLGEASHGTHEYYVWRDSISRRLIGEHNFRFIAVEGDWASLYELNRYVKDMPGAASSAMEVLENLDRWPHWMWGNYEVVALAEWLRQYNDQLPWEEKAGFYGMDVYDEWRSKNDLLKLLEQHNTALYTQVYDYFSCLRPYDGNSWAYAQSLQAGLPDCTSELKSIADLIKQSRDDLMHLSDYDYFNILQNALVVKNAEKFYRKSVLNRDASSWNSRVQHMNATVNDLLELYGDDSQAIVWAHNTHVGDARYTEMRNWGQENIGHLSRETHGEENVFIVGFSTFQGNVKAGSQWGGRRQNMRIPPARMNSIDEIFNRVDYDKFLLVFDDDDRNHAPLTEAMGNRAVGVIYDPQRDHQSNYVMTIVPHRYDAIIFFRETRALNPLGRR